MGVETGGCLHTAIREDASMNLAADRCCRRRKIPRKSGPGITRSGSTWLLLWG
jgi:hypothetical protein